MTLVMTLMAKRVEGHCLVKPDRVHISTEHIPLYSLVHKIFQKRFFGKVTYFIRCASLFHSPPPTPVAGPRQPFHQMARMMDSLIMDPFVNNQVAMSKAAAINSNRSHNNMMNGSNGSASPNGKPIGPVRPRVQSHQNQNAYRVNRNNNFNNSNNNNNNGPLPDHIDYIPANPNTAGAGKQPPHWAGGRTESQISEDAWKASLRKRDPELQPTLPNLPARSR